jgi:hypothetical protein
MSRTTRFGVLACVALLVGWGCTRGPTRIEPPNIDAEAAGQQAMQQYDSDRDGSVGGAELDGAPALKAALGRLDQDNDGKVSAAEVTALVKKWQEDKLGKMPLPVTVKRRGQPLVGATVKFVPEEFLGPEVLTAEGVTDENGIASLSIPLDPDNPNDRPGVQCGLFRVEITKEGVDIPAKYNTQTILGKEVALGDPELAGLVYNVD